MSVTLKQFREELTKLRWEYGVETLSKKHGTLYPKIVPARRAEFLLLLVTRLQELGAQKGFFSLPSVHKEIYAGCNPPKSELPKHSWKGRVRGTGDDLELAVIKVYGTAPAESVEVSDDEHSNVVSPMDIVREEDKVENFKDVPVEKQSKPLPTIKKEPKQKKERLEEEPELKDVLDSEWDAELGWVK